MNKDAFANDLCEKLMGIVNFESKIEYTSSHEQRIYYFVDGKQVFEESIEKYGGIKSNHFVFRVDFSEEFVAGIFLCASYLNETDYKRIRREIESLLKLHGFLGYLFFDKYPTSSYKFENVTCLNEKHKEIYILLTEINAIVGVEVQVYDDGFLRFSVWKNKKGLPLKPLETEDGKVFLMNGNQKLENKKEILEKVLQL